MSPLMLLNDLRIVNKSAANLKLSDKEMEQTLARLDALDKAGLLDSPPERDFDRLTELTRRLLHVPVSLVSLVGRDRQFFKSSQGLPEPWASQRQTPLSLSFCRHVVDEGLPLIINDARHHGLVQGSPAIQELGIVGYLGIPLFTPDKYVIGSLCAITHHPRDWSDEDVENLSDLAALVIKEIELRFHLRQLRQTEQVLQQRTRELEQSNQELEQFAQVAAHDLGNPLNTIMGFSELLQKRYGDRFDAQGKDLLAALTRSSHRMKLLLQDLLEYARAGHQALNLGPIDLSVLVESVLEGLGDLLTISQADVQLKPLPTVLGDELGLRLLFQNLLENAIKYCGESLPIIQISAMRVADGWHICVSDNGIGIESQYLEVIFEPFRRLHTGAQYPGTGIGLATCKRIAERHDGRIWAESEITTGSIFHLLLPAIEDAERQ